MENLIQFINDPNNATMLYVVAGILMALAILFAILRSRGSSGDVHVGGNMSGIINTGTVKGNVQIGNQSQPTKHDWFSTALDITAKLAAISGFLLALWVYFSSSSHV